MKKIIVVVLVFFMLVLTPLTAYASAEEAEESFQDLYNDWEMNGYPDYVGHVVYDSDNDNYVIGLVDPSEAEINELEEKLADSPGVVLGSATYSYNELLSVQEEIMEEAANVEGIYGMGLGLAVIDGELRGFGESGLELRVVVSLDESIYDEYSQIYSSKYGDMVYTEVSGPATLDTLEIAAEDDAALNNGNLHLTIISVLVLAMIGVYLLRSKAFVAVRQSAAGTEITESSSLSRNEVVSAVKESNVEPRDDLYEGILDKLKK